jgi:hypothetical protein
MKWRWSSAGAIPPRAGMRTLIGWLIIILAVVFVVVAGTNLWAEFHLTLTGVSATGRVVEFHPDPGCNGGRCASREAQVEVSGLAASRFRTMVQDRFGLISWEENLEIPLICTPVGQCVIDSARDRWLLPVVYLLIGGGLLFWRLRQAFRRESQPLVPVGRRR